MSTWVTEVLLQYLLVLLDLPQSVLAVVVEAVAVVEEQLQTREAMEVQAVFPWGHLSNLMLFPAKRLL
jgi:hypothetical protein